MRLTKHHALGNDFLVLLDLDHEHAVDGATARALCERHTGIGADGLIHATPGTSGADVAMALWNSDGSRAETSGNGLRCLAQAMGKPELLVATDAGPRRVALRPGPDVRTVEATADMGIANCRSESDKKMAVDLGNPHLVLLFDQMPGLDPTPTDVNVEYVVPGPGRDAITMRVIERGAGETQACGSGACAAAWAAHRWGLVGEHVTVHMAGGDLDVELGDPIRLTGPAAFVASIEVPWH